MEKEHHPWLAAEPKELPKPTYGPFFLALGIVFLLWGITTTLFISVIGGVIFVIALFKWINLMRHE